ncbi:hypothetical protein MRX96_004687 [Rhipicephalus microplus]
MSLAACASTGVGWVSSMTMMRPFVKVNAPKGGDDADDIETVPENIDLDDPVQLAIALNAMSKTIFFNEEGEQRPRALLMREDGERSGELDDAAAADKLINQSHSLHLAPGENRVPLALFMDAYAEELAFPTIYMGVPRKIIGPRSTPFAMASSEIRRTDRRGATTEHVLYMAAKVMRYNVAESKVIIRTNETTGSIMREQLESSGKKFLEEVLDRNLAFMRGVPNTVHYWQDRRSELFAMIRHLGKPHVFLTMSASEVHWERLLETLEWLRVGPDGTPRPVSEMMAWERVELVVNSASVLEPGIPSPDLPQKILSSHSFSFEDMKALTSIVPETTEPHQTMIVGNEMHCLPLHKAGLSEDANKISHNLTQPCLQTTHTFIFEDAHTLSRADTWLPRDVCFEKIQTPSQAEATAIENLPRTALVLFPSRTTSLHATIHQNPPEAISWTTSENSAVRQINRPNLRAGDLVLLKDKQVIRFERPVGVIVKCLPSAGGNVRKAEVRTAKNGFLKTFVHPISDLVDLMTP